MGSMLGVTGTKIDPSWFLSLMSLQSRGRNRHTNRQTHTGHLNVIILNWYLGGSIQDVLGNSINLVW